MLLIKVLGVLGRMNGEPMRTVCRDEFHNATSVVAKGSKKVCNVGRGIGRTWKVKDDSKNKAGAHKRKLKHAKFTGTGKAK